MNRLTMWYDELCLVENPYFQSVDIDCWACEDVRSVLDLSETDDPNLYQPHIGFPYIVKPFPEGYKVFLMQGSGERLIVLDPVPGCNSNCTRVSVLLKPSYFLYYNSWFYKPKSYPVENSSSISNRSSYFFIQVSHLFSRVLSLTPFQTHCFMEKLWKQQGLNLEPLFSHLILNKFEEVSPLPPPHV
uniref:(California timema) hypothetical protein n=1 Tax=Timema californicum TaxID=61474 RepID=A0A7R9JBV1_TIMCA|nr:unnamed protein product [Timema californicum]